MSECKCVRGGKRLTPHDESESRLRDLGPRRGPWSRCIRRGITRRLMVHTQEGLPEGTTRGREHVPLPCKRYQM